MYSNHNRLTITVLKSKGKINISNIYLYVQANDVELCLEHVILRENGDNNN